MQRLFLYAIMIMMIFQCSTAVGIAEDETEWYYNIAMSIRSANGEGLPSPSVPLTLIQDGIVVSAYNDCLTDNKMMLVLFCNGHIIPFSVYSRSKEPVQQTYFTVLSKEETALTIYPVIDEAAVQSQETAYLHVILIGLCDVYPQNELDDMQGFSTVVSIPVTQEEGDDVTIANNQPIEEATEQEKQVSNENLFYGIKILSVNDVKRNSILFKTEDESISLRFAIVPDDSDEYVCCFVDNALQQIDGYDGIWIHASEGMSYEGEINLQLEQGKHQIYLMRVPLYTVSPCFVTSEKIVVEVIP
jgi:hypothetical protein